MAAILPTTRQASPKSNGGNNVIDSIEIPDTQKASKVVTVYKHGVPVIRVEKGTTLGVLKLLYESETGAQQILGVRPQMTNDVIPCIITLDESKLIEPHYDIMINDKASGLATSDKAEQDRSLQMIDRHDNKYSTAKCMECSRESWKSKKFATTGMNTEVSVNPGIEIDLRVFSGINGTTNNVHYVHPQSVTATSYNGRLTRLRSNVMRQPPVGPMVQPAMVHVNSSRKEVSALPAIQVNAVKSLANTSDLDVSQRQREASPSLSPSPGREIVSAGFSNFQPTQITYPRVSNSFHSEIRYEHPPPPLRSPRLRSPHDIPRSPSHMNGESVSHHATQMQHPSGIKEQDASDANPTVYVLPNDFDLNGGYESHFHPYAPSMSHDDVRRHDEMRRHEELRRHEEIRRLRETRRSDPELSSRSANDVEVPPLKRSKQESMPSFALPTQVNLNEGESKSEIKYSPQNSNSTSPISVADENGSPAPPTDGVTNTQKLYCKICHKVFPTKSLLYKHLRGHSSDEKPYKCPECGQGFTLSSNLRQHRIIHRGYKPFQCEFCGKKFMRSNVYKQHRRIHTGEEMYKCSLCPSEFLQKYALVKHMKKQHDIETGDNI
eukprot:gene14012-15470_t